MRGNTVQTQDGAEVYINKILELADDYINDLDNPDEIKSNNNLFNGMIKYIYIHWFKHNPVDYNDIDTLNDIWGIYTSLCYKYNKNPTIIEFCLMVDINRETITSWKNETTRKYKYYTLDGELIRDLPAWKLNHPNAEYTQELSKSHSNTVKKWLAECEQALYRGATEKNSVGCIFALKANYGYTETAPIPTVNTHQQELTMQDIQQRLAQDSGGGLVEDKGEYPN